MAVSDLQLLKKHCKIDHSSEDDLLEMYYEWAKEDIASAVTDDMAWLEELYSCYACIQDARESDMQTSLTTSSQFIKTIIIRDPRGDYKPNNKHYVIHDGEKYQIKYVKKDYQDKSYVRVYCEVVF